MLKCIKRTRRAVGPHTHIADTGSKLHEIVHYLTKPSVGLVAAEALAAT